VRGRRFIGLHAGSEDEQFAEGPCHFGLEILALLHFGEVVLQTGEYAVELALVGLLPHVEFDDPSLEDSDEVQDERVVRLLLLAGGEPRVDRHFIYINYYTVFANLVKLGDAFD
jgi:hypothetical protein